MVFSRFTVWVFVRALLLAATVAGLGTALVVPEYYAVTLLLALVVVAQLFELNRYVGRTHTELTHFLDAVRSGDFSHRYLDSDSGFAPLARQFSDVLQSVEAHRTDQETRLRQLTALTEHLPVPLLSVLAEGRIKLHNHAARRLFGRVTVMRLDDLAVFGTEFHDAIATLEPGHRRLVRYIDEGVDRQLSVLASRIVTGDATETLVSLQDIQSELDANQLQTWHELVRVLTHEIMNSVTPVASLAKTAADVMTDIQARWPTSELTEPLKEDIDDARQAVDTLARRAEGIMGFIQRYRSLTQLPSPRQQSLDVTVIFERMQALMARQSTNPTVHLSTAVEPANLLVSADPDLLDQVLLNLLTNAWQATETLPDPVLHLQARQNHRGQVVMDVIDNGPGIPEELIGRIFVPFFTTKREGSGVGLALARQIMIAHGGHLTVARSELGGARFSLTFQ